MQIDTTALICDALIQPFDTVPNEADDLMSLIATPLIRKLPVSSMKRENFLNLLNLSKQVTRNVEVI